jgi:hypothetical protein
VLHFLEELATLHIIQASKTVLPPRDQPIPIDEGDLENCIVYVAVRVGFNQLHVWQTVKANTIVQVGDRHEIFPKVCMCAALLISRVYKIQNMEIYMWVWICFDHFNIHGSIE